MTREALPHRRYSESSDFMHLGIRYHMQIGAHDDGRVGEIFMGMEKAAGTIADVTARDIAILISMALQHGVPIERMLKAITKDENGQPEGLAGAVLTHLLAWEPKRDGWGGAPGDMLAVAEQPLLPPSGDGPAVNRQNARDFGFTGDQCTGCQNFTMVRNGTCLKCQTCGTTTGCS